MLYTDTGPPLEGAGITTTSAHVCRGDRPDREWNPVAIVSFKDDAATEALLTSPVPASLRQERQTETAIATTLYRLDGLYQVLHEGGQTYVWYWLDRVEDSERLDPAVLERLKLQEAQIQAQTERTDFIEDCMAEMATVVYTDVPAV